jgi:hypothetical protein
VGGVSVCVSLLYLHLGRDSLLDCGRTVNGWSGISEPDTGEGS